MAGAAGDDGSAAMADVLRKRRLDREVIELLLEHEPGSMTNLVAVLEAWKGREEEHLAALREKYCTGAGEASSLPHSDTTTAVVGQTPAEHCALAADCLYSVDTTLRAAVNRILFARASPLASTVDVIEATHLLNVMRKSAVFLRERFPASAAHGHAAHGGS